MVGHSYFCTCLLLQTMGIVCRHSFCVTQGDSRWKYRISLVLKRWFREQWQDLEGFETKVGSELLVAYPHYIASTRTEDHPANTCARSVHILFSTESSTPQPRKEDGTGIARELAIRGQLIQQFMMKRYKRSTTSQSR
ncbi:hypothetical protein BC939DRAFT_445512 [Gamsiella multidivaricata]|uniref:uncharacterized protein n=1 Tax=Gamsiella multidivaricata TaxID=101098 RepID=UPI00221F1EEF|nr:uncharacterized protein BC939DRAFT_445512 [Gamsiella multidivaricata]KAI7827530.1 hypothetical protein BC939DRAFT_445512 [Gamsiella multidivaricata]